MLTPTITFTMVNKNATKIVKNLAEENRSSRVVGGIG
tara:strand:- start:245 stop:355 length:111 start_codon:yes stop_codon:yes gene_type:complete